MCDFSSLHSAHGQSCIVNTHDNPNIKAENTNNHGSIHSGIKEVCAISGANNPTKDKTIGKTQQNKCGNIDAIIPNFTALFFIFYSFIFWRPQQNSNLHLILRRDLFYPIELWGQREKFYTNKKINQHLVIAILKRACIIVI